MREVRIDSESATDVVTVQEVKDWGKLKGSTEDQIIAQLIKSCRQLQEQWTGRSFIEKTLTVHWDQVFMAEIPLPFGPIRSITSIKRVYEDGSLSDALVSGTDYFVSGMDFKVVNLYKRWQSAGQVVTGLRAEYDVGHDDGTTYVAIPWPIKETVMRHVITDYLQRDDLEETQPVLYDWVKEALAPYRIDNLWL
jgi:uncharacterized phiE125 gp8 family phage protein